MSEAIRVPPTPCPCCGYIADAASSLEGNEPVGRVNHGDFTVCIECGALLQYGALLQLVTANEADVAELAPDQFEAIAKAQRIIRRLGRRPSKGGTA